MLRPSSLAPRLMFPLMVVLTMMRASPLEAAPPEVRMYGASWCGPCRTVKAFLERAGVPFRYLDVDQPANLEAFRRESPTSGIPLTVVGEDKVRGANLPALLAALEKTGHFRATNLRTSSSGTTYGGHAAGWWQAQFRELRAQIEDTTRDLDRRSRTAQDNVEKEAVSRLKERKKFLEDSLDQLEHDASNVALPREYRQ